MKGLGGGKEWNRRIRQGKGKRGPGREYKEKTAKTKNHLRGNMET